MDPDPSSIFQRLDQSAAYPYAPGEYVRRVVWRGVERVLVRTSPARCFGWRAWWLRRFGAGIGASGTRPSVRVWHPWLLEIGDHSILGDGVEVYNLGRVTIGSHTVISQGTYLCAGTHDYTKPDLPLVRATIAIGSGVWIGAQAFVGPGVTIGDNAIVGARAVVTRDVPPGVIVAGNPARVIKQRPLPPPPEQPPSPPA